MRFDARVGVLACVMAAGPAWTQDYPARPVRLVVPYPAGSSSNDIIGRFLAQRLSTALGQQVLVENRAGAGGNVGSEYVAKAAPDGYTLLVATNGPQAIAPNVFKLNYDSQKDLAPVAMVANVPYMLVVGDKEAADGTIAVRSRQGGDLGSRPVSEFLAGAQTEVASKGQQAQEPVGV